MVILPRLRNPGLEVLLYCLEFEQTRSHFNTLYLLSLLLLLSPYNNTCPQSSQIDLLKKDQMSCPFFAYNLQQLPSALSFSSPFPPYSLQKVIRLLVISVLCLYCISV